LPSQASEFSLHLFAQAAQRGPGKFWEVRDRLLSLAPAAVLTPEALESLSREIGIDTDQLTQNLKRHTVHIGTDIKLAEQYGVTSPQGIFVNGRRLDPALSGAELLPGLTKLVDSELVVARKLVKAGTPKAYVYKTLIADGYWAVADDPEARKAVQQAQQEDPTASAEQAARDGLRAAEASAQATRTPSQRQ